MPKTLTIRQGDVALVLVTKLPEGCAEIPNDRGRIVLAYGEVTGHAHAITDHRRLTRDAAIRIGALDAAEHAEAIAAELAEAAIARARLLVAPNGQRYLQVDEQVTLTHEEHTAHVIPPGIYHLPTQVEYTPAELRRVAD
jgi:hypothetical protein